jgi:heme exporter protein A
VILRAEGIQKRFEARSVLLDATIEIAPGGIHLLLGANGSGKTTLANILATLLAPDRGRITVDGEPIARRRAAARRAIGFASHRPLLYLGLTPLEKHSFFGGLAGDPRPARRAMDLLERLGMAPFARSPGERFYRGKLQRIELARALMTEPRVLLLDEPYTGLDEEGVAVVNDVLREARERGAGSLVITHEPERVRALATRVSRLEGGRIEAAP